MYQRAAPARHRATARSDPQALARPASAWRAARPTPPSAGTATAAAPARPRRRRRRRPPASAGGAAVPAGAAAAPAHPHATSATLPALQLSCPAQRQNVQVAPTCAWSSAPGCCGALGLPPPTSAPALALVCSRPDGEAASGPGALPALPLPPPAPLPPSGAEPTLNSGAGGRARRKCSGARLAFILGFIAGFILGFTPPPPLNWRRSSSLPPPPPPALGLRLGPGPALKRACASRSASTGSRDASMPP